MINMNGNKTINNARKVGGDYFRLINVRSSNKKLDYFLTFNKEDYYIFKTTRLQKEVTYEEMLEFKYSGYIFFKKSLYDKEQILKWIEYFKDVYGMFYLVKPTPPFNPNKIIIRKRKEDDKYELE